MIIGPAESAQQLFDGLCAKHGGADAMSHVDFEIVAAIVKSLAAIRSADPAEAVKIADTVAKLSGMLPPPVSAARPAADGSSPWIADRFLALDDAAWGSFMTMAAWLTGKPVMDDTGALTLLSMVAPPAVAVEAVIDRLRASAARVTRVKT